MIIPRKEDLRGLAGAPKGSTNDTKRAVVFATLGLPLNPAAGVLVMRPAGHDRLDGEAFFSFDVAVENWDRVNAIYAAGKGDPAYTAIGVELERMISNALVVYGRRFLENFVRTLQFLKSKARDIEIKEKGAGAYVFKFYLEKRR
jgi:hypothetical protein